MTTVITVGVPGWIYMEYDNIAITNRLFEGLDLYLKGEELPDCVGGKLVYLPIRMTERTATIIRDYAKRNNMTILTFTSLLLSY